MESEDLKNVESGAEPSLTSNDPNERKLARRIRIERRLETARIDKLKAEGKYVMPEPEKPLIDETIETCEDTLRRLYFEGKSLVTNVKVASDFKEVQRREDELKEKNLRLEKLREETRTALKKLDEISEKWETILDLNGPLELFQHMKEQKAKCLELIEQKNSLIKSFQMELKVADEKYMKDRKAMYDEVSLITKRIDEQVLLMKRAYRLELEHIEESVDATRYQIMDKHKKTWTSLYNQREKTEVNNMGKKFEMLESLQNEQHQLHIDHEEKFRETKIQLETDIQMLEQELEQVKALCLLNSEKLDYNYQVLKKREEENVYIKNHQKRRLNKLQDVVNTLKKKIDDKRNSTDEEVKKLTREVERYHASFLGMEAKMYHFSYINQNKFLDIWKMKEKEANDLVEKILSADMVIHEQILGHSWTAPTFTIHDLAEACCIRKKEVGNSESCTSILSESKNSKSNKPEDQGPENTLESRKRLLHIVVEAIADQSGFLMEEKLDDLLQPYTEDEKTFVRLDNVFVAIGIKTERDIEIMAKIFEPYVVCLLCEKRSCSVQSMDDSMSVGNAKVDIKQHSILQIRELEEKVSKLRIQAKKGSTYSIDEKEKESFGEPNQDKESVEPAEPINQETNWANSISQKREMFKRAKVEAMQAQKSLKYCLESHPLYIEKFNVLQALKDFVSSDRTLPQKDPEIEKKRFAFYKLISKDDICSHWVRYMDLLPTDIETVWDSVFHALNKYLRILQGRHALNMKAKAIRRQNLDMKRLLSYYKIKRINREDLLLPVISSVPTDPIDPEELVKISNKILL